MKRLLISLLVLTFLFPKQTLGHLTGQPPYFKINDVFTDYYPVPSTSLSDFNLPQDISKENFLTGQEILFEIDTNALPVPQEIIDNTKFLWEFGDGEKAEGLKNTHTYSKMGTFFMVIYADSQNGFEPQILQTTAINILPDMEYKLPKSEITLNGKQSSDPLTDILEYNLNSAVNFDASLSDGGSSEIIEYFWDTGDINSSKEKSFSYKYAENPYIVFPLLRIKTKDGFIADSYIQLSDAENLNFGRSVFDWKIILLAAIAAGILTILLFTLSNKIRKKGRA